MIARRRPAYLLTCWAVVHLAVLLLPGKAVQAPNRRGVAAVVGSKHDLTIQAARPVGAVGVDPCSVCHVSHTVGAPSAPPAPLWNPTLPVVTYRTRAGYTSSTYEAGTGVPEQGSSKLCLSCHDGTLASGQAAAGAFPGPDLSNHHPVGIRPVDDGQLTLNLFGNPPETDDPNVKLLAGRIECLTCHNPHDPAVDPVVQKFLVRSNRGGTLCLACHDPNRPPPNLLSGWPVSAHATAQHSVAQTAGLGSYGSVETDACANCHQPHNAPQASAARLQRGVEEATCSSCHGGANVSPSLSNVMSDFLKTYAHPTFSGTGLHDPAEDAFPLASNRHAECPDCHNPHAAGFTSRAGSAPFLPPPLLGASGYDGSNALQPAGKEFEVCFKCHADSPNKPQNAARYSAFGATPVRQAEQAVGDRKNLRQKFSSVFARHNVTQPRRLSDADVPSVRPFLLYAGGSQGHSLAMGTYIYCTDCHDSNSSARAGGAAASGPHGSLYPHILAGRYQQEASPSVPGAADGQGILYSPGPNGSFALCDRCHDIENSILRDRSFRGHRKHVVEARASCSTCHEPHGIHDAGGTAAQNPRMVSFDLTIVGPDRTGALYIDGIERQCYLSCHGVEHGPKTY